MGRERIAELRVEKLYHLWLVSLVDPDGMFINEYSNLMDLMDDLPFTYVLELDRGRYLDGIELRTRFDYEASDSRLSVYKVLEEKECSILECLVALFCRYSDDILVEPGDNSLAPELFYTALGNLGLLSMDDSAFDEAKSVTVLEKWCKKQVYIFGNGDKNLSNGVQNLDLFLEIGRFVEEKYA